MSDAADMTRRAQVRDAALEEFAERGMAGASVRSVAARAGVSPGLVQHHFRTKQALRKACDAHVVNYVRRAALEGVATGQVGEPDYLSALLVEGSPIARYLARALGDGTSETSALFDELVAVTETYLAGLPRAPSGQTLRDRALVLTAMRLGPVVLATPLLRGMGLEDLGSAAAARIGAASLALLHPDLLTDDLSSRVQEALATYRQSASAQESQ